MKTSSLRKKIISSLNSKKIKAAVCFQNKTRATLKFKVSIKFHKFSLNVTILSTSLLKRMRISTFTVEAKKKKNYNKTRQNKNPSGKTRTVYFTRIVTQKHRETNYKNFGQV